MNNELGRESEKNSQVEKPALNSTKITTTPDGQAPADTYDDGNIPQVDLPQNIIPDEVPRKDGPGGEGEQ